jgi:hypothetical protein
LNQFVFFLLLHAAALFLPVASFDARVLFFAEVLALPLALGWLAGINLAKGWNQAVLRRLSMPVQAPIRRAYDHAFADDAAGRFVILSFQDGTKVYGYFGERSLAANDGERSDIFLERLYDVSDDGQWYEKLPHRSGLMMLDGLRSIEFMLPEEGRDAPNRTDASD